ncbi:MAG: mismatch-specific DNA-glycosylase [Acidimicrobiales bacterium]
MSDLTVKASSDEIGLRREAGIDVAGLPIWLARLHRALPAGTSVRISVDGQLPLPLSTFTEGAGFRETSPDFVRELTLADLVAPGLKALVCGLNPSPASAETGIAFGHKGNRFWPAAVAAGLVSAEFKPEDALMSDRVGFTDLAKRTTSRASELSNAEFQAGFSRLERLLSWAKPNALIVVGLTGWRIATNRQARPGWQPDAVGGTPVYLMPNTSGLNAHESLGSLTAHFEAALAGP